MFGSLKRPAAPSTRAALLGPIEKPQTGGSVPPAFSYPVATSLTANSYELARPAVHVGKFGLLNVESRSVILRSECRTDRTAVDAQVQKPQNNQVHFTPIVSEFSRVEVTIEKPPSERVELHPTFQRMQFAIEVIAEWQAATSAIELLNSCGFLHVEVSIEKPNCEALHFQPELRASRFWSDKFSKWWVTSSELNTLQSPTTAIGTSDLVDAVLDWQRNYLASRNTEGIAIGLAAPGTASIPVALRPPKTKGRIFVRFCPGPLKNAGDESRKEASRQRAPDDDPFASLFYLLLAQKNWDVRVKGLDALLAAYPENKRPFRFQFEGIQFLASRKRALLADEMGLGKTVQAILAMRARIHAGMVERVLITCPKSLLPTWYTEISIWAPELSVTVVHGPTKQDAISRKHHVYITNYETVTTLICGGHGQHQREIKPFDLLIVDEIQFLKNASSKKSIAVSAVIATQRWALTGTPLENSFDDYRTVWNVISPKMKSLRLSDKRLLSHTKGDVLRREKAAVLKDLPKKVTRIQLVELEGPQLKRYRELENAARHDVSSKLGIKPNDLRMHVLTLLTKLKQQCLYDEASGTSAKLDWLQETLEEMHPTGVDRKHCEKALVFTQYPNLVCDKWKFTEYLKDFNPLRYDGSLSEQDRIQFTTTFQTNERHRVAFISLKAGGTGLTLTRANQVVFLDQWWNPAVMEQAAARVHRIGQNRMCLITSLIAKDTVDERILKILSRKHALFKKVMQEVREGKKQVADLTSLENALSIDDMLEALGLQRAAH